MPANPLTLNAGGFSQVAKAGGPSNQFLKASGASAVKASDGSPRSSADSDGDDRAGDDGAEAGGAGGAVINDSTFADPVTLIFSLRTKKLGKKLLQYSSPDEPGGGDGSGGGDGPLACAPMTTDLSATVCTAPQPREESSFEMNMKPPSSPMYQ